MLRRARVRVLGLVGVLVLGLVAAPTPPGVAATTAPYCGPALYKADGTKWKCTFADEFNSAKLDPSKWSVLKSSQIRFGDRPDCFVQDAKNIAQVGGVLKLTTRRRAPFSCGLPDDRYTTTVTSAAITTIGHFSQNQGRFEMRAKFPYTTQQGLQAAFWLWPLNGTYTWPISGEIDIAEWYSKVPDRVIPYFHYALGLPGASNVTNNYCLVKNVANWHTYTLEWVGRTLEVRYDGRLCLRNTSWVTVGSGQNTLQLSQALGIEKNAATASTPLPATTSVAWVRVWS